MITVPSDEAASTYRPPAMRTNLRFITRRAVPAPDPVTAPIMTRPGVRLLAMARDPSEIVQAGYDQAAARYRALEHDSARWPRAEWIGELTKGLRPGAAVLDLGCAAGVPVAAELARRYRVTGVDISPEHIQQATRNVPDAEFVCSDALTVTFPAGHFDAIISLYTFDHIPRDEHGVSWNAFAPGSGLTACSC
jgi:SAM-dependent methyltransferase